jgi:hypothetical protein
VYTREQIRAYSTTHHHTNTQTRIHAYTQPRIHAYTHALSHAYVLAHGDTRPCMHSHTLNCSHAHMHARLQARRNIHVTRIRTIVQSYRTIVLTRTQKGKHACILTYLLTYLNTCIGLYMYSLCIGSRYTVTRVCVNAHVRTCPQADIRARTHTGISTHALIGMHAYAHA